MRIQVEMAPGELIDKFTILQIKLEKIDDKEKLHHIQAECHTLTTSADKLTEWLEGNRKHQEMKQLGLLIPQLKEINQQIWDIEDDVRDCERQQHFGNKFVQLARSVYLTNDKRAKLKKEINILFDSDIMEEKSYTEYTNTPKQTPKQDHVKECNQLIKEHSERNNK